MQRAHGRVRRATRTFQVRSNGFTLIELMVTLAVAAILMAIAAPSFTAIVNSNRLTSAANEMVATLQIARMEAVRRNAGVVVCTSDDGTACGGTGQWLVLAPGSVATDVSPTVLRVSRFGSGVQPSSSVASFSFRPDGFARDATAALLATSFRFCMDTTRPDENVRLVDIAAGSRVSTSVPPGGGACP